MDLDTQEDKFLRVNRRTISTADYIANSINTGCYVRRIVETPTGGRAAGNGDLGNASSAKRK